MLAEQNVPSTPDDTSHVPNRPPSRSELSEGQVSGSKTDSSALQMKYKPKYPSKEVALQAMVTQLAVAVTAVAAVYVAYQSYRVLSEEI